MSRRVVAANLALAFGLELCALAALSYWDTQTGGGVVLAVCAPLAAAVLWGLFASPRARFGNPSIRFLVKVLVFGGSVVALFVAGQPVLAVVLAVVVVANAVLLHVAGDEAVAAVVH